MVAADKISRWALCFCFFYLKRYQEATLFDISSRGSVSMTSKRREKRSKKNGAQLRAVDLFSGCGGLTHGLKLAGFDVVGAVENDKLSADSYEMNHGNTRLWRRDIRELSALTVKRALGIKKRELDLLAGCPPCQGFSTLVTNNGRYLVDDPRNSLIYEFMRFVEDLMPRAVLMENVPNLSQTTRFRRFFKRLEHLGYKCEYRILDAAEYGVPQRRKRLVFIAGLKGEITFARPAKVQYTVRSAFSKLRTASKKMDPLHDTKSNRTIEIQRLIEKVPINGGSRTDIESFRKLPCHKNFNGFYDVYGRMSWDGISPTITSGCINPSKGRFLHPNKNRAITLREAALLQSFPKNYRISLEKGKYKAAAIIGNSFPPEFARRQALMIKQHLITED